MRGLKSDVFVYYKDSFESIVARTLSVWANAVSDREHVLMEFSVELPEIMKTRSAQEDLQRYLLANLARRCTEYNRARERSDEKLARRADSGDREALDELVQRHNEPVDRIAAREVRGWDIDPEDVTQVYWTEIDKTLHTFIKSATEKGLWAYLRGALKNKAGDARRKCVRARERELHFATEESDVGGAQPPMVERTPEDIAAAREVLLNTCAAFLDLTLKDQIILYNKWVGIPDAQTAAQLGLTVSNVRKRRSEALKRIRDAIESE